MSEILSKVISEVMSLKDYDSFDEGVGVEDEEGKMDEKESSLQRLALGLLEALINRFPAYSYGLIESLVNSCISTQFANMDKSMIINLLNVCSILPAALRGNNNQLLDNFPIQSLISFAYNSNNFPDKYPSFNIDLPSSAANGSTNSATNKLLKSSTPFSPSSTQTPTASPSSWNAASPSKPSSSTNPKNSI